MPLFQSFVVAADSVVFLSLHLVFVLVRSSFFDPIDLRAMVPWHLSFRLFFYNGRGYLVLSPYDPIDLRLFVSIFCHFFALKG